MTNINSQGSKTSNAYAAVSLHEVITAASGVSCHAYQDAVYKTLLQWYIAKQKTRIIAVPEQGDRKMACSAALCDITIAPVIGLPANVSLSKSSSPLLGLAPGPAEATA